MHHGVFDAAQADRIDDLARSADNKDVPHLLWLNISSGPTRESEQPTMIADGFSHFSEAGFFCGFHLRERWPEICCRGFSGFAGGDVLRNPEVPAPRPAR